ncbi:tetratricopeptide repeat protein [Loktanella sp. DJP18]|uniref:tetratricopeptide repeat protein n=1 Tax=Loktanella sp. DJP18 TaxID=3409788 RepID=UPI003BB5DE78
MSSISLRPNIRTITFLLLSAVGQTAGAATFGNELLIPQPSEDTAYLLPISRALDSGNIARAEDLVRKRLSVVPQDAIAWEVLGVTLALGGRSSEADAAYAKAVEIDPARLSAWVKWGDLAEASGNKPDAMRHWASAIEIAPTYGPAHQRLGTAHADAGDLTRAILHLEAALAADVTGTSGARTELAFVYNRADRPEDTLALFSDPATMADADARRILALGNAHAQLGAYEKALTLYQQGIRDAPQDNALLKAQGAVLVNLGQADKAVLSLAAPAEAEPVDAFANLQYAIGLLSLGRTAEAVTAAERAAGASGSADVSRQALTILARAHLATGNFSEATAATTRLTEMMPDDPAAWREHAAILGAAGQYEDAKTIYDKSIAQFAGDAPLLRGRSMVNIRLGDLDAAAQDAATAAEAAPAWLEPQYMLGEIEQSRRQGAAAEAAFRAALLRDPNHWPSLVKLAGLRLEAGDVAEVLRLSEQAVSLSGGAPAATDMQDRAQSQQ